MRKEGSINKNGALKMGLAVLFWLLVWAVASLAIGQELFLPSPWAVLGALAALVQSPVFWQSVGGSLWHIGLGFLLGLVAGVLLAALAAASSLAETLLRPLMLLVRSVPVASFIILMLVWVSSRWLSTWVSFLMVLPVLYGGTLAGLRSADGKLLEMAAVFRLSFWRRVRGIYLPALMAHLLPACELAVGMSWKSGVAAEVIGLPAGSIGERLYQAKIYLMMPEMFAWTVVILLLSALFGWLALALLRRAGQAAGGEGAAQ